MPGRSNSKHPLRIVGIVVAVCALAWTSIAHAQELKITDVAGRTVTLPQPAKRIVLGQGRHLPALSLIHPDPVSLLAGWQRELIRTDAPTYELYRTKFPAIQDVPILGEGSPESFSIEKTLALKPDVVILSFYVAGLKPGMTSSPIIEKFDAAGIPVVVVDFFVNPIRDTLKSLAILGQVIGRDKAASDFIDFYQSHLARIKQTLAQGDAKPPRVFMHAHAGSAECCYSSGSGTFDDFISIAGGQNIAAGKTGSTGQVSLEYLVASDPDVYVATGGVHLTAVGGLVLGTAVDADKAKRSFAALLGRPGLSALSAVSSGRKFALWHLFNDTPAHIVALEWLAKWFHPDLFKDLDPAATMDEINKFSAVRLDGTYWVTPP